MTLYSYDIVITNKTGHPQTYSILQERPHISLPFSRPETTRTATITVQNENTADFTFYRTYYAMCGASQSGQLGDADVLVYSERPVTLGTTSSDGPGSTVLISAIDGMLQFDERELPACQYLQHPRRKCWPVVVIHSRVKQDLSDRPKVILYLSYGSYAKGTVIDLSKAEKLLNINFDVDKRKVTIIHDADKEPSIQT
jgi:hypothetical protein